MSAKAPGMDPSPDAITKLAVLAALCVEPLVDTDGGEVLPGVVTLLRIVWSEN